MWTWFSLYVCNLEYITSIHLKTVFMCMLILTNNIIIQDNNKRMTMKIVMNINCAYLRHANILVSRGLVTEVGRRTPRLYPLLEL